jgi:ParB-like chromosome segregation protein Spo0J
VEIGRCWITDFDPLARDLEDIAGLVASLRANGQLQPITIAAAPNPDHAIGGDLLVLDGRRRLRAMQADGQTQIAIDLVPARSFFDALSQMAVIHASHRSRSETSLMDLIVRVKFAYELERRHLERRFGAEQALRILGAFPTQTELAEKLDCSQSTISRYLALLYQPRQLQELVGAGKLTVAAAVETFSLADPAERVAVAQRVVAVAEAHGGTPTRGEVRAAVRRHRHDGEDPEQRPEQRPETHPAPPAPTPVGATPGGSPAPAGAAAMPALQTLSLASPRESPPAPPAHAGPETFVPAGSVDEAGEGDELEVPEDVLLKQLHAHPLAVAIAMLMHDLELCLTTALRPMEIPDRDLQAIATALRWPRVLQLREQAEALTREHW